ncbi:MAG TPA: amidohydrolase family protein [Mesorhizobium sp.]|jgi:dihydropyrimidinase|nr:amidohydrolase family protein [Mesorhizobium sp.]
MSFDLVIKNGRVISGIADFVGDVAVSGERIVAVGSDLSGRHEVDATGKLVIPGAIDGHVHMRTERKSFCYDETFATGSVAAAFGGTTTIIDQIQVEPGLTLNEALDARLGEAEGQSSVDFAFHMNIREESDARLAEIGPIMARGITSFKWFMAIPGWGVSDEFLMRGMWETANRGALNVVHAENRGALAAMRKRSADRGGHSLARFTDNYPAPTEAAAIHLAMAMTEVTGGRTLIFHNTCAQGVEAIRAAKGRGVEAYGEVCLAYLTHDEDVYRGDPIEALPFLVTPPIRDAAHQLALWNGLARGDLDIVSTDHTAMRLVPEAQALELAGYFGLKIDVPPATPATRRDAAGNRLMPLLPPGGVETRLPLVYSRGVGAGKLDVHRWVEVCCSTPARLFDLRTKGHLLPGYDADIVIFDPDGEHVFSVETMHSNTDYSVWEGWKTKGRVEKTFSRGRLIVDGDRFLGGPDHGRYLHRSVQG